MGLKSALQRAFDAFEERLHHARVQLIADDLVFVAGFDTGVVVHFDEIELGAALLQGPAFAG